MGPSTIQSQNCRDLLYLQAKTLEGNSFEITASVSGFFVNGSSETAFNQKRGPKSKSFVTLVELLQYLSPKFTAAFKSIETRHSSTHAFSQLLSSTPNYAWAVAPKEHTLDAGRSLDAAMVSSDIMETICARDWNDDSQGSLDLPKEAGNDRITRDQAVLKSYINAATRGAMAIVNKALSPNQPRAARPLSDVYP